MLYDHLLKAKLAPGGLYVLHGYCLAKAVTTSSLQLLSTGGFIDNPQNWEVTPISRAAAKQKFPQYAKYL